MLALNEKHSAPSKVLEQALAGERMATEATVAAMRDLYNPAQLDVFVRIWKAAGLI